MNVTFETILGALRECGVREGDTVLAHSSLKSMGWVDGGPETVIAALRASVGETGTVALPTLIMNDFRNSYRTWYDDKPSDTGLITEVFRKMPGVLRSSQPTHPVAAIGARAEELTRNHGLSGRRTGVFGDTPFAVSSPWQRFYDWNARIVLIGVNLEKNTIKHLLEYILINEGLDAVTDPARLESQKARLRKVETYDCDDYLWPWLDSAKMQSALEEAGLLAHARCGNAEYLAFPARDAVDLWYAQVKADPAGWYSPAMLDWFADCK